MPTACTASNSFASSPGALTAAIQFADSFISQVTDGAGGERGESGRRGRLVFASHLPQIVKDIPGFLTAAAPVHHPDLAAAAGDGLEGISAKIGIASDALSAFHALQQEAVTARAVGLRKFQVSRHRTVQIRHDTGGDWDHIAAAREPLEFGEVWEHGRHN